jgi:hypothetical protein
MSWLRVFVDAPWLAVLPAVAFGLAARRRPGPGRRAAAGAWLVYGAYESAMALRVFGSGEGNIRIDLFLIYPFLLALSVAAAVSAIRVAGPGRTRRPPDARRTPPPEPPQPPDEET